MNDHFLALCRKQKKKYFKILKRRKQTITLSTWNLKESSLSNFTPKMWVTVSGVGGSTAGPEIATPNRRV